ncbi:MAG: hypothetical protein HY869_06330 [Chloroflexi bacterium]|nr:hypothetical protein [Chloroflexota bacterium]
MKLFANLLVAFSLVLGQFNFSASAPFQAERATPTPTGTATATLTPSGDVDRATPTSTNLPPTETPTATEEIPTQITTPVITQTVTPIPSSTPIPPLETVPPVEEPQIILNLSAEPGFVTPGATNLISWSIEGISPSEHELSLEINLPKGFTPADKELKYDEATRILSITLQKESGQFELLAQETEEQAVLLASLVEKETVLAEFALPLPLHEQFTVDERGGEIVSEDARVKLSFPANTLREKATITIGQPGGEKAPVSSLSGRPIEITASNQSDKAELHEFDQPITLEIQYSDLNIPEGKLGDMYIYWYNPETDGWEALVSSIDTETQTVSTETTHFSVFDIGINDWQANHLPTVDGFQVSQFTGAGSFSLPIDLPAGPGGLKPSLTLSYNSQVIDQARIDTQASWVGMGWSLDAPAIERDAHGTSSDTGDDTFMLSVAGVSTRLVNMGDGGYQAQDKNFWRIERDVTADTWTVWDKAGNIYYFGDVAEENVNATSHMLYRSDDMHELIRQNYRWALRRQQNVFGKYIRYTYTEETKQMSVIGVGGLIRTDDAVTAVYPEYIIYPNNRYRVWFDTDERWDYYDGWKTDEAYHSFQRQRLEALHVQHYANGVWSTVSKYNFGYADNNSPDLVFPGVSAWHPDEQELGKVTTLVSFWQEGLPPGYTFSYADKLHLTYAANGYGGSVQFDYDSNPNQVLYQPWYYNTNARQTYTAEFAFGPSGDMGLCLNVPGYQGGWTALSGTVGCTLGGPLSVQGTGYNPTSHSPIRPGAYYKLTMTAGGSSPTLGIHDGYTVIPGGSSSSLILLPATAKAASPVIQSPGTAYVSYYKMQLLPTFYRVYRKTVSDGTYSYTYQYTYPDAAVNDTDHSLMAQACYPNQADCNEYNEELSEFRGHEWVTETGPDGRKVTTYFWQDDARKGSPISIETRDPANKLMNSTLYTYGVTSADISFWSYYHIQGFKQYWVYTDTEEHRTYNSDGATYAYTLTDNTYEPNYGNLTSTAESSSAGLYRTTFTDYFANTSGNKYLVGLPARRQVKNASGTVISESLMIYDSNTVYNAVPTTGILAATRTWVTGANYNQTTFGYDSWGNQTSVTAYSGYGTASSVPASGARTTYTCMGGGGALNGTTCVDDGYHTYALWTKNPLGQLTSITYDYAKGVPVSETDPNGAMTTADYDTFGRIRHIFLPDPANPNQSVADYSLEMTYFDSVPFITAITQRTGDPAVPLFTIKRVYDGMGRQTLQASYAGSASTQASTVPSAVYIKTQYPQANITQQSAPYGNGDTPIFTVTTQQPDGRTTTVTSPDGTSVTTYTNGLTTTVTDPRGNITTSVKDVWGRTTQVTPPSGTGPFVSYTYDPLGNMLTATRGGATVALKYDSAGRKVGMDDPDMGVRGTLSDDLWGWTYQYDALGNLLRQTDAKDQTTCLYYDDLSRLLSKHFQAAITCPQVPVTSSDGIEFQYDSTENDNIGKGRRTSMTDPSGSTSWTYDYRGRVTQETKVISGVTKTTQYTYNLANMPLTMTYPDEEVVSYAYTDNMLLDSLSGTKMGVTTNYVQSSAYDSASRLTDRSLGNGLTQKFVYNDWTTQGGRLDKIVAGSGWNGTSFTTTLQSLDYTYDASGNIRWIENPLNNETQEFQYDNLDRLTDAQASGANPGAYNETYEYDPSTGNFASRGVTLPGDNPAMNGGLTAHWNLNETSGTRYDAMGISNLTVPNTVGFGSGRRGNAASFSSSTVLSGADTQQTSTGDIDFTLAASFYPTSASGVSVLVNKGSSGNANIRDYALIQSNSTIIFTVGNGVTNASVSASFSGTYTWHTVVAWHDSVNNTLNIQIDNGTPVTTSYGSGAIDSTYPLSIGGHANSSYVFNGRIDEVSLYKRVLGANERAWLFQPGDGNLAGWWSLNEASGQQRNDSYGTSHLTPDGTVGSVTGQKGNAASFSSSPSGVLTRADNAAISTGDVDFTLVANFYLTNTSGVTILVNKGQNGNPNVQDYALIYSASTLIFRVGNGSTNAVVTSAAFTPNAWHTVFAWHDSVSNTINIQIDNGAVNTASYSSGAMDSTYPLSIGAHADKSYTFKGLVDEVSLYKRVFSAYERSWLYNAGSGRAYSELGGTPATTDTVTYTYDPNHKHAVNSLSNGNTYTYDANGNMTARHVLEGTAYQNYTLSYDAENRLVQVQKNGATIAEFTYDGDGKRVKSEMGAETILFFGAHYEVKNGNQITQYYMAGAARIAMRTYTIPYNNMTLTYLMGDHLGSTSLAVNATTGAVVETRYKAWGEVRYTTPNVTLPTRNTFTGQYSYVSDDATDLGNAGFGLMFYNARWYDPYITHFVQADTIIPAGVQGLDRYAGMNNNPIKYSDPSGHDPWYCETAECEAKYVRTYPPKVPPTPTPTATPTPKPEVRIYCGFGSWTACSNRDPGVMAEAYKYTVDGKSYYPLQLLVEKLEAAGYHVDLFDPSIPEGNQAGPLEAGKTYIDIGFSSGAEPAMAESESNQVVGLVLLDPYPDPETTLQIPGQQYIAYSNTGIDNSIQHHFSQFLPSDYPHTQLSVSDYVAGAIMVFIDNIVGP